jgi:hypothetical protein
MNMHQPVDIEKANLSYYCRGCKQKVRGIPLTIPQYHISEFSDNPWLICRCPNRLCKLSFVVYDKINDRVQEVYPFSTFEPDNYHEAIPEKIRVDIAEGERCFHASAYKGSVTMNRRAIQRVILDKIETKSVTKMKLWEQINELYKSGFITKHLADTAHEIRHFGNFGAHPQDDLLDETTEEDAGLVDNLTWEIIKTIYVIPFNTKKLNDRRKQKKGTNKSN